MRKKLISLALAALTLSSCEAVPENYENMGSNDVTVESNNTWRRIR